MKLNFTFLLLLAAHFLAGQTTTNLSATINRYTQWVAYDSCSATLTVVDTVGFRPGAKVLIYHTQGGTINTTNTAQFGTITNIQNAGRYEIGEITTRTVNTLTLKNRLIYPLLDDESAQIISFPEYDNAIVSDTLRPLPWNGITGGVIAFKCTGSLTINAPILADGAGFKGGYSYVAPTNNCSWLLAEAGYLYALGNWRGGVKGEGIVPGQTGQELGRGPRANGGGGGNDHNSGGGGGSNTSNGGQGGNNDEPSTFGCDGQFPGLGAKGIANATGRIFLGGGGGAGHTNNLLTSDGGAGGGIIFIEANNITGNNPKISANGQNGMNSGGDGAGGAGAGGSIWLKTSFLSPNAIVRANGGNGGTSNGQNSNRCFGPGGGGGGGRIITNQISGNLLVQGGTAGTVTASTNSCNGAFNGASNGQDGSVQSFSSIPAGVFPSAAPTVVNQPLSVSVCAGDNAVFSIATNPVNPNGLQWQRLGATDWDNIAGATTNTLTLNNVQANTPTQYRCVVDGGGCFFFSSDIVFLQITPAPVAQFTGVAVTPGTYQFNNQSQNTNGSAFWDFGDGFSSTDAAPVHSYINNGNYTVTLTVWNACDTVTTTQNINLLLPPNAAFSVPDTITKCNVVEVLFVNTTNGAVSYNWTFAGGNPGTSTAFQPSVTYSNSGNYTARLIATNAGGTDTIEQSFYVQILSFPVASFVAIDIPGGTQVQFNFTGSDALFYTWTFGDGSPAVSEESPLHTFPPGDEDYIVRLLVQNECGASILEQPVIVNDESVAVHTPAQIQQVVLFPNPAQNGFWVQSGMPMQKISLVNALGQFQKELMGNGAMLQYVGVEELPAALYWVRVVLEDGTVVVLDMVLR
jgi:PKD repeat protein